MKKSFFLFALGALTACTVKVPTADTWLLAENPETKPTPVEFYKGSIDGAIVIDVNDRRQTIDGFGNSITESSVFVLACLTPEQRHAVLEEMYGEEGANFSASRTVVGSSDFALKGHYSFDDVDGD